MTRKQARVQSTRLAASAAVALTLAACTDPGPVQVPPVHEADLVAAFSASPLGQPGGRQILILDACDPASFNEAFGAPICNPLTARAGISFETFVKHLLARGEVNAWRFAPDVIRVPRTTTIRVVNAGGIPHNLVEVAEFGPGIVPELNAILGLVGDPVAECVGAPLLAPGESTDMDFHPGEDRKYMCCIHPWMQASSG